MERTFLFLNVTKRLLKSKVKMTLKHCKIYDVTKLKCILAGKREKWKNTLKDVSLQMKCYTI